MTPAELWQASVPVTRDRAVCSWLEGRGIPPAKVARLDLARALPLELEAPAWARRGWLRWAPNGYRVLVPLFDHRGELRSLSAILAREPKPTEPLVVAPKGLERMGLSAANGRGLRWLTGSDATGAPCAVVRGELAYLERAAAEGKGGAVFGLVHGASWARAIAKTIPDGSALTLETGNDAEGIRARAAFTGTLAYRLEAGAVILRGVA